jgi:hypothetical protein
VGVTAGRRAFAVPRDRDALLVADPEGERRADGHREHGGKVADHGDQAQLGIGHVDVSISAPRRPVLAAHVLREDPPGLDPASDVDAHVAVERCAHILRAHGRRDADRGRFVAAPGVERARDLPLLVEDVPALLDPARDQHGAVDPEQVLAVETCFADLAQRADRLGFADDRHRARTLTTEAAMNDARRFGLARRLSAWRRPATG